MNKIIVFFLVFFLIFPFAFSTEFPLSKFGFEETRLEEFNSFKCYSIVFDSDILDQTNNLHPILSIYADFVGKENDSSYISIELNENRQIFWKENFVCDNRCVARMFLEEINAGDRINFCIKTGASKITIFSDSKIGFYDTPVLKIKNISPNEITLGERSKMQIVIENSGSKKADVFVQFVAEDLRSLIEITSFDIVEGDASATTTIQPNESKEFVFYIKPIFISNYNLPSSELFFENIFGENQRILSNHPQLSVIEPDQAEITIIGKDIKENEFSFIVKIKNKWGIALDGNLILFPKDLVDSYKEKILINPFSEKEFVFVTKKLSQGNYFINAQLNTTDFNYLSESIFFPIIEQNFLFEIFFSLFAILLAIIIFLTIYFSKK
ncbi:MAG: hypothetical protein PHP82_03205 [Candidatus ainarchaeum sp.]|nr:hypothetical protein [Candidatus ainarchaeum sp.]